MTSGEHKAAKNDYAVQLSRIKSNFELYVNDKEAKEYEQSLVASTDIAIISNLNTMSLNESELLSKISAIKSLCDNIEYQGTVEKFRNLYNVIDAFTKTYQEIQQNVVKCSNEAFEELLNNYNNEKQNFNDKCTEIDTEINNYETAIGNYDSACSELKNYDNYASDYQISQANKAGEKKNEYRDQMNRCHSKIPELLAELNKSLETMTKYLEDGLKICPVTTAIGGVTDALAGASSIYEGANGYGSGTRSYLVEK